MTEAMFRILVVEDDPAIRNVLKALLESERFRYTEAETAARAEIEARANRPDLVLVDLGLPDGDGLTVIQAPAKVVAGADSGVVRAHRGG